MATNDFIPTFDPGEFRYAVARYVRLLIRARLTQEPRFLSPAELATWDMKASQRDLLSTSQVLELAAGALAHINTQFVPRCGSGGLQWPGDETPLGRLMLASVALVPSEGGGPDHNGALIMAARDIRSGRSVDWNELVEWTSLPAIRVDLDQLPHPSPPLQVRLATLEENVQELIQEHPGREWYSVEEFAELVGKAEFTVREWCRHGRIRAEKQPGGRGSYASWVIGRAELDRYRAEGLISVPGK